MNDRDRARLLVLDSQRPRVDALEDLLRRSGRAVEIRQVPLQSALPQALAETDWDLVLVQVEDFPHLRPILAALHEHGTPTPLVYAYGPPGGDEAVAAHLDAGAQDYLSLEAPRRLAHAIWQGVEVSRQRRRLQRQERALRECGDLFLGLFEPHPQAMAYLHEGMHILANRRYRALFGDERPGALETVPLLDLADIQSRDRLRALLRQAAAGERVEAETLTWRRDDGTPFSATLHLRATTINGEPGLHLVLRPQGAQVVSLDRHRPSGPGQRLLPPAAFLRHLEASCDQGRGALLFLEADEFAVVQESVGVVAGEQVLDQLQALLIEHLPESARLARMGGGVFTLFLPEADAGQAQNLADSVRQAVEGAIFTAQEQSVTLTASIGIAPCQAGLNGEALLAHADLALAFARTQGGGQIHLYQGEGVPGPDAGDLAWAARLRQALEEDAFTLVFMPIVALHGRPERRYEALLRLRDEQGGLLPPDHFLYPAEQAGLAPALDHWVLRQALAHLHELGGPERLFVKIGVATLRDPQFLTDLGNRLQATPELAGRLTLEINEADAAGYLREAKAFTEGARAAGARIALEHFGTQPDSLRLLRHLAVDTLKIDAGLVARLHEDEDSVQTLRRILEAAREHRLETIAEQVEDARALDRLWRLRVDYIQGHYLRPPREDLDYDFDSRL